MCKWPVTEKGNSQLEKRSVESGETGEVEESVGKRGDHSVYDAVYLHQHHEAGTLHLYMAIVKGILLQCWREEVSMDPGQLLCMVLTGDDAG